MRYFRGRHLTLLVCLVFLVLLTGCAGGVQHASWFGVVAGDDAVFMASNAEVVALDLESGAKMWSFPLESNEKIGPFYATPLVKNTVIDVGGYDSDGMFFTLSQDGGTEQGTMMTGAPMVEGPASVDGALVVGNNAGEVYLIETETQEKRLLLKVDDPIWATPRVDQVNGRVYVPAMDHYLYAVDIERGEEIWAFEASGALVGTPALSDGAVYFGSLNNAFYAVDTDTAGERWRFETQGWVWGGPVIDGDTIYFGDLSGNVYALDIANGSQRWTFKVEGGVRASPVLRDGVLYVGTREGKVYALEAQDGVQQWVQTVPGAVYSQPVIGGNLLLVSPHNAKVQMLALDPESGAERWSYPPQEE